MSMSESSDVSFHHQDRGPDPLSPASAAPAGSRAVFDIYCGGAAPSLTHSLFALCFIERDESVFPFHRPASDQPARWTALLPRRHTSSPGGRRGFKKLSLKEKKKKKKKGSITSDSAPADTPIEFFQRRHEPCLTSSPVELIRLQVHKSAALHRGGRTLTY